METDGKGGGGDGEGAGDLDFVVRWHFVDEWHGGDELVETTYILANMSQCFMGN